VRGTAIALLLLQDPNYQKRLPTPICMNIHKEFDEDGEGNEELLTRTEPGACPRLVTTLFVTIGADTR
jgi:hypothetical protein